MIEVRFGPSGRGEEEVEGKVVLDEIPKLLCDKGLDAFEYSFTRGVRLGDDSAKRFGEECKKCNISLSVHAPYYINLANKDPEMIAKSFGYFEQCIVKMKLMGADRLVFHPASLSGMDRPAAVALAISNLAKLVSHLREKGLIDGSIKLCPETMGKHGQVGTVDEIVSMCLIDPCIVPTIDFGHINAFGGGSLKTQQDFEEVFQKFLDGLGERARDVHIHFSKIEYGQKGEKRHLNLDDEGEPDFRLMLGAMKKLGIGGRVVSESSGHQVRDSVKMQQYFKNH